MTSKDEEKGGPGPDAQSPGPSTTDVGLSGDGNRSPWGKRDEGAPRPADGPSPEARPAATQNPWTIPPPGRQARARGMGGMGGSPVDDMMASLRRFGGGGGGGGVPLGGDTNGKRLAALAIGGLVVAWVALTCFHRVESQEAGVVMRLGRYSHTLQPGISLTLPAPIDRVITVDVRNFRTIRIPEGNGQRLVLTGDQNIIDLDYSVRWDVSNPVQFLFQLANPPQTVTAVAESAMREAMANTSLNDAIGSGRAKIEAEVAERIQQVLNRYGAGIRIQGVAIQSADPPAAVNDAFKQVTAAQQEAQTAVNRANAHSQQVIAGAEGAAGEFDRVYEQYRLAPEVTRRRLYYETMEQVLSRVDKTIVEAPGVVPYLQLRQPPATPVPSAEEPGTTTVQARPQGEGR